LCHVFVNPNCLILNTSRLVLVHVGRPIGTSEDIEDVKIIVVNDICNQDNDVSEYFDCHHSDSKSGSAFTHKNDLKYDYKPIGQSSTTANSSTSSSTSIDSLRAALTPSMLSQSKSDLVIASAIVDVWCVPKNLQDPKGFCTRTFFKNNKKGRGDSNVESDHGTDGGNNSSDCMIQPGYRIVETDIRLCSRCSLFFDSSLIVSDSSDLSYFSCMSDRVIQLGIADPAIGETLERSALRNDLYKCDAISFYVRRLLLNTATQLQVNLVSSIRDGRSLLDSRRQQEREEKFMSKLKSGCTTVEKFENKEYQRRARASVDFDKIKSYAEEFEESQRGVYSRYQFQ
jgi:hypothetical protein